MGPRTLVRSAHGEPRLPAGQAPPGGPLRASGGLSSTAMGCARFLAMVHQGGVWEGRPLMARESMA